MLAGLGRWCHNRRRIVVVAWVALLVVLGGLSSSVGSDFSDEFKLPNVESARGLDILDAHFGGEGSGQTGSIVFRAEQGVDDPSVREPVAAFLQRTDERPDVRVVSPYSPAGQAQVARSTDPATIAYAEVELPRTMGFEDVMDIAEAIVDDAPAIPGVTFEYGGVVFQTFEPPESEILGLAFAIFILIMAFGSVLAMGLPIGTAVAGIGAGSALVALLSSGFSMPDITPTIGVMIGLGVGIDYALFIITRFREGLHTGMSNEQATVVAIDTAGRAVLFAGITVVISLLGMVLMGVEFVRGLGVGAALTVAVTMVASITLLPALLGFAGARVEVTRYRGLIAAALVALALIGVGIHVPVITYVALPLAVLVLLAGFVVPALRREVPRRAPRPAQRTLAYRWSRLIQHHPWKALLAGSALLLVMAIPVLSLRLGFSDEGNFPESTTTRRAYDLLAEGFGPGFNGPMVLAAEVPAGTDPAVFEAVTAALQPGVAEGVAFASPAVFDDPAAPGAVLWRVVPTTSPQDAATTELVHRLRDDVLPPVTAGTGLDVAVSGNVAVFTDFSSFLAGRLPLFFGVVLALSFLLLMTVFRSVLVPLKAVVMNLVSIGASYGLVVAIFQWGWAKDLVGIGQGGPIEPFVPMMMFAIVFGLSMDYEVFLLSRVKEEWDRGHDNARAVADGLAATARVITAAAAIMVFIFGSFLLESDRIIKLFGLGLASAVLLDATVVRMVLVPATMELLGDRNWWMPRWLGRILPTIHVEGAAHHVTVAEPEAGPGSEPDEVLTPR